MDKSILVELAALKVDSSNQRLTQAISEHPERLETALSCLREKASKIEHPTQFLAKAILSDWQPRKKPTKSAPSGFGEWFTEAKKRGIAIASELRDKTIFICKSDLSWHPFNELSDQSWAELATPK